MKLGAELEVNQFRHKKNTPKGCYTTTKEYKREFKVSKTTHYKKGRKSNGIVIAYGYIIPVSRNPNPFFVLKLDDEFNLNATDMNN
ncbi:hypothetical protein [Listeria marthii]|uniref:hypothetical protein n=1 Tax=Listeria marthii TaxID=529731 RepID=UPI0016273017|nr:hypothetical protein [Listeria marthii]MBC2126873.1 hypothetical protein [Listeria marthii]